MSYNLFLDDYRLPRDCTIYMQLPIYTAVNWIIVRNYYDFINIIKKKGVPDVISFNHDLADVHYKNQNNIDYCDVNTEKTGYHCAKWLIEYCIDNNLEIPETIIVHSMNPAGKINIKSLFDSYLRSLKL